MQIRQKHPRMGGRKIYKKLECFKSEHQIKMGRDALFDLLSRGNLLIRRRKRTITTTQSFHWLRKYPNLIKEFTATAPNQLWVSDITYWKLKNKHVYISFITDAYSHKIVGYHVAETLATIETIKALKMALASLKSSKNEQLIHHSDRGIQYCSSNYVNQLKQYNILISMTGNGDPRENAIAERINGIIKDEYLYQKEETTMLDAKRRLNSVVKLYNNDRPHLTIGNETPDSVHSTKANNNHEKLWKSYKRKSCVNQDQEQFI